MTAAVRDADDGGAGGLWRRRRGGGEGGQGEPGAVVRVRGAAGGAAAAGEPRRLLPAGTQRAGGSIYAKGCRRADSKLSKSSIKADMHPPQRHYAV